MDANNKHVSYLEYKGRYKGLLGWIFSTDHKRIGLLYLYTMLLFFSLAAILGLLMKLQLIAPGYTIMGPQTYNSLFTLHGIIMIFIIVVPGLPAVFGNFFLPIMIGAKDVAFPRLNLLSWWVYIIGILIVLTSQFMGDGPPDTGWTFYAPYSFRTPTNVLPAVFGAFVMGFSSILTGINFVVTIHRMRAPGMTWFKMPLFPWGLYGTAWIQILATPVIGITLLLIVAERTLGIGFFDPALGGDPILYQHLFWIYSHPAVYIMILPGMGAISEIIPVFSRKPIFGYKGLIFATMAIGALSVAVWAHHMYVTGSVYLPFFALMTMLIAVPTGVKFFNWIGTMWKGSVSMDTPMLWTMGFLVTFLFGGLTGIILSSPPLDFHVSDSYFVVAHFHYTVFGTVVFLMFAGLYFWWPKMTGKMLDERLGKIHFWLLFIGFQVTFLVQHWLGVQGMPRRYGDYLPVDNFTTLNVVSTVGAAILGISTLFFIWNVLTTWKNAPHVTVDDPWGWGGSLEWATSCPPPRHNFTSLPRIRSERPAFDLHHPELAPPSARSQPQISSSASRGGNA